MVQYLRMFASLANDIGLVPRTHGQWLMEHFFFKKKKFKKVSDT